MTQAVQCNRENNECLREPTSHKADMFEKLENDTVKCIACSHYCTIRNNQRGICGIRFNVKGQLYLAPYGYPSAMHMDPMEKKPFYHFHPNNGIISFGVIGCNFRCQFCQNWTLSFNKPQLKDLEDVCQETRYLDPQEIVGYCLSKSIKFIAFTYNEPTIAHEYYRDIAILAKQKGIKCVYVSNGYMSEQAREKMLEYISAFNIDLKGFNDDTYRKVLGGRLQPVLNNIEYLYKKGVIVEVTTLVVPGMNDSDEEITNIAEFLATKCGPEIPWHLSAFHPDHQMMDKEHTSLKTLERCYEIGKNAGLKYVYLGNVRSEKVNTYCPQCGHLLIDRSQYVGNVKGLRGNQCEKCSFTIYGEF